MKKIFTLFILISLAPVLKAQDGEKVKWYSVGDINRLLMAEPRPVFIDAYTDWCGWCKELDKRTFSDTIIAKYLNENFYPVKFDAESKEAVTFLGKEYVNDGKFGKAHQLAFNLLQGRLSYPTVVFLNEKGELLAPVPGYREPKGFEPILVYFSEKRYLAESWEDFIKSFKGSY
ncbi:MAG TPA: DUF255 domain-containing protein [Bacteroidales bacterium]|nr:DUF255 domain-containing protein [Bacteroidales bacterium]